MAGNEMGRVALSPCRDQRGLQVSGLVVGIIDAHRQAPSRARLPWVL